MNPEFVKFKSMVFVLNVQTVGTIRKSPTIGTIGTGFKAGVSISIVVPGMLVTLQARSVGAGTVQEREEQNLTWLWSVCQVYWEGKEKIGCRSHSL